jgi:3-hydroxy acid dehydrogenase/malonic semialdehyde reductase
VTGRRVLVTGASGGIGRAIVEALRSRSHDVLEVSRRSPLSIDLSDLKALEGRLPGLKRDYPDTDALVLCAGRGRFGAVEEFSYQQIRELVDLNLTGPIFLARAFLPSMKRRGQGDIIFIGSEAGLEPGRRGAIYSATKSALSAFARALRDEAGKAGVRVSVIHPGPVRTGFYDELSFEPGQAEDEALTPEDVASAVVSALESRQGAVWAELHLSPLKKVIRFRPPKD